MNKGYPHRWQGDDRENELLATMQVAMEEELASEALARGEKLPDPPKPNPRDSTEDLADLYAEDPEEFEKQWSRRV